MHEIAIAFWGAFFGTVGLMLVGSVVAYLRSLQRVALRAALSAGISALYALAYLGVLPTTGPDNRMRFLAHVSVVSGALLGHMLLAMVGLLRNPATARWVRLGLPAFSAAVIAAGWLLPPRESLALSSLASFSLGGILLSICVRGARRGDRLGWMAVFGVTTIMVAVAGLSWIALDRDNVPWQVHAVSAVFGMAYMSAMAVALWIRYSYLIELRQIVAHGPSYDPVTRMRSHSDTGQMVGLAFFRPQDERGRPVGVIAVSIGNLSMLESLHGPTAANHALFVCASRLRRCVPVDVEMGRLGQDAFLLLVRGSVEPPRLEQIGRMLVNRLSRPVVLSVSTAPADLEAGQAHWVAQVGVGLLATTAQARPSVAVAMARNMSRTAWSYASRVAWHDEASGQIAEVPAALAT